jgi:hypothetical protein
VELTPFHLEKYVQLLAQILALICYRWIHPPAVQCSGSVDDRGVSLRHSPQFFPSPHQPSLPDEASSREISRPVSVRDFTRGFGFDDQQEEDPGTFFGISDSFQITPGLSSTSHKSATGLGRDSIDIIAPKPLHSRQTSNFSQSMQQISSLAEIGHSQVKDRHSLDLGRRSPETLPSPPLEVSNSEADLDHSQSSVKEADEVQN